MRAGGDIELEVIGPETNRTYFLVDSDTHRQSMEALRRQQNEESRMQRNRQQARRAARRRNAK